MNCLILYKFNFTFFPKPVTCENMADFKKFIFFNFFPYRVHTDSAVLFNLLDAVRQPYQQVAAEDHCACRGPWKTGVGRLKRPVLQIHYWPV